MATSSSPVVDRIRVIPRPNDFLDRNVGSSGEVFFNRDTNSLRVFSGKDRGGFEIAKTDLSNISNSVFAAKASAAGIGSGGGSGASISISATAPQTPANGNLWLSTENGYLYVYINDGTSSQWIQPAVPTISLPTLATVATTGNYNDLSDTPILPQIATSETAGLVKPGVGLAISQDGTLSVSGSISLTLIDELQFSQGVAISEFSNDSTLGGNSSSVVPTEAAVKTYVDTSISEVYSSKTFTSPTLSGTTTIQQSTEILNIKTGATGVVEHDFSTGAIFYHLSISAGFTANFTNVPTTNNRATSVVLVLTQGATPRVPSTIQINGVTQTIKWQGGEVPVGTANGVDLLSLAFFRVGSAWASVTGSLTTYE